MKNTWFWLVAVAAVLALSGTTNAGSPTMTMLLLPQLFGQEPSHNPSLPTTSARPAANPVLPHPELLNPRDRLSPEPEYIPIPSMDDDSLGDVFWDAVSMMLERTCSAWVVQKLLPLPPLNLAADAVLGYFSVMDAREAAAESARLAQSFTPPPPPAGPGPVCEMLPFPKMVSGPGPCAPKPGCTIGCGVGSLVGTPIGSPAEACVGSACCDAPMKTATKCKCCEECTDCKECTCGKKTKPVTGRIMMDPVRAWPPPAMHAEIELSAPPMAWVLDGPLGQAIPVPAMPVCPPQFSCNPPTVLHPPVHDLPLYPVEELNQLIHQRQMITRSIEQIEQELMRMTLEKQKAQTQAVSVTHSTQKVHLASEMFEAHCNALRCVEGEPHRLILEGDVRLVCKKSGHPVCIEAPCVTINMKDGTFTVLSLTTATPCPVPATSVHRMEMGPMSVVLPISAAPAASYPKHVQPYGTPMPMAAPVPSVPQGWQQIPYRVAPPTMPAPPRSGTSSIEFNY